MTRVSHIAEGMQQEETHRQIRALRPLFHIPRDSKLGAVRGRGGWEAIEVLQARRGDRGYIARSCSDVFGLRHPRIVHDRQGAVGIRKAVRVMIPGMFSGGSTSQELQRTLSSDEQGRGGRPILTGSNRLACGLLASSYRGV